MAYLALYRAWRPQRFADVVGQQHVTRTLQNAIREKRISHAYLFSGPRGTGKTSMAKILAKAINCEQGPAAEPCNTCEACQAITEGRQLDVIEIDAASNRGVDEIRDLREKVKYAPASVRYKVYIIDEVHMLTPEAFNALLKTLEEPPAHVLFVMATTEPHKIPLTILSRCQRFDFHRVPAEAILSRLEEVAKAHGAAVHPRALATIARLAEGGMRDALSLLDQAISFTEGEVTAEEVLSITGGLSTEALARLWTFLFQEKTAEALQEAESWVQEGKDPAKIVESLFDYSRGIMLVKAAPHLQEAQEQLKWDPSLQSLQDQVSSELLVAQMEVLQHALQEMKWTAQPRTMLELILFKLSQPELISATERGGSEPDPQPDFRNKMLEDLQHLQQRLEHLEQRLPTTAPPPQPDAPTDHSPPSARQVWENQSPAWTQQLQRQWDEVLQQVRSKKITVHAWVVAGEVVAATEDAVLLSFKTEIHRETTDKPENRRLIEQTIEEVLGRPLHVTTVMKRDLETFRDPGNPGDSDADQPVITDDSGMSRHHNQGGRFAQEEEHVQKALEWFGDIVEIKE